LVVNSFRCVPPVVAIAREVVARITGYRSVFGKSRVVVELTPKSIFASFSGFSGLSAASRMGLEHSERSAVHNSLCMDGRNAGKAEECRNDVVTIHRVWVKDLTEGKRKESVTISSLVV
jgi:hypothetical protein